jgi:uncharacterized DUF497 family protein
MSYQWDPGKAAVNLKKHNVDFADAIGVLEDEYGLWREDVGSYNEDRFVAVGMDYLGRILVVAFTIRGDNVRIISARNATPREKREYEREQQ